jgi:hypothetical protein
MTHFQALFGYPPPCRELSTQEASSVATVNEMIARRVTTDQWLQKQWDMAKNRMKQMIDKHGIERISSWGLCPFEASTMTNTGLREFPVGGYVHLKLQLYKQSSIALIKHFKFNP